jgi:hypothetical protein
MRKRHAGAFENRAFGEHPAFAATAFRALPGVAAKFCRVDVLDGGGDAVVQIVEVAFYVACVHTRLLKPSG